jgi:hypothetical protein
MENFEEHFHMPITVQAFQPYEELQQIAVDTYLTQNNGIWIYPLG